jgi:hypothetical protein
MSSLNDLTGRRFGKLVVQGRSDAITSQKVFWVCLCDCGETTLKRGNDLTMGKVSTCGCSGRGKLIDLSGMRFGKLLVVSRSGRDINEKVLWECVCDCGARSIQRGNDLTMEKSSSCGCAQFGVGENANAYKHGMSSSKIRAVWSAMKGRCKKPSNPDYPDYGGRGVRVCDTWEDFENFLADMGLPEPRATLERIDNDGNYCKDNCRWATRLEQSENRRNSKSLTIGGVTKTISAWSRASGISYRTIRTRLKLRWKHRDAVFRPLVVRESRSVTPECISSSPVYRVWVSMRSRCRDLKDTDYGGRGISVDPSWENFDSFLADMGDRPPGTSLDRVDVNKGYGPGNCRWASQTEQIRNRRSTRTLTIDGATRSIAEWSEISGVKLGVIINRLKRGKEPHEAVFQPARSGKQNDKPAYDTGKGGLTNSPVPE